ncbi:Na+/H+ antiporter subunit E [Nocardia sp. NPDC003693]
MRIDSSSVIRIGLIGWLAVVYTALWGDLTVANLLAGLVIGVVIVYGLPLPRLPVSGRLRLLPLIELIAVSTYYALLSSAQVAWYAIRPSPPPVSGVLRIGLTTDSDLVLVLWADVMNLIPGTMVLELDRKACVAEVHVLDVSPATVRSFYTQALRVEQMLIASFERPIPRPVRK